MELTDLQLEIMRLWADKILSFGCIVEISDTYYDAQKNKETNIWNRVKTLSNNIIEWDYIVIWWTIKNKILQIIWHPITRWRLCYLRQTDKSEDTVVNWVKQKMEKWINLCWNFENNPSLYNKTILEWDEKTLLLVRDFLLSIQ